MNEEKDRQALLEQKQKGQFNLKDHLKNHPISGIISLIKLPKEHPLRKLKNEK